MVVLWNFPWARICWATLSSQKSVFLRGIHQLEITNSYHRLSAFVCQNPVDLPSSQGAPQRTSVVLHFRPRMSISRAWLCTHHSLPFSLSPFFFQMRSVGLGFTTFSTIPLEGDSFLHGPHKSAAGWDTDKELNLWGQHCASNQILSDHLSSPTATLCSCHPSAADLEDLRFALLIRWETIPWLSELWPELAHPGAMSTQHQIQGRQKGNVHLEAQGAGLLFLGEHGCVDNA